ncbi:MAG TPA: tetratricopeptide repeat protein, partial [Pyrinomonadaceae bacterium]
MRHRVFSFALLTLILCVFISTQAQTPEAAVNAFNEGLKKTERGDLDGAIEAFTRAIALSSRLDNRKQPSHTPASSFNGSSVPSPAEVVTDNVTVINPFTADAYNNRGFARFKKSDFVGAVEDFNSALRIRPGLVVAYLNRAAALQAKGDSESAIKDLNKAVALKKDFYQAYINRGSLFHDLGHDAEALADLNRAIELKKDVAEAYYQRGYVQLALSNWDASVSD